MVHETLRTLDEAINIIEDTVNEYLYATCRDSLIQRFEYSADTLWKFLKIFLQEKQNMTLQVITPRETFRVSEQAKLISSTEYNVLLECIADRNLTSHIDKAALAQELAEHIPLYYKTMSAIIERIQI